MASVLSLTDAKAYLGIGDEASDTKLQGMIDAAEAKLTNEAGALQPTSRTDRVRGGSYALILPTTVSISLTSVTPVGSTALNLSDLYLDAGAGMVTYVNGGCFATGWYDVVYQAGRATLPAHLLLAVKERVRVQWETQRGPLSRPGSTPAEAVPTMDRSDRLIKDDIQPGFA